MATQADSRAQDVERVSIGRVFSRGFEVVGSNPGTVFGITFTFSLIPYLLLGWLENAPSTAGLSSAQQAGLVFLGIVAVLAAIALGSVVQGALVYATLAYSRGEKASFGESLRIGLRFLLPLIALSILYSLGVALGTALLIVPGIIAYCMWAVAAPSLVAERTGVVGAFSRSRELTRGARWKVLGVLIVLMIAIMLASGLFAAILNIASLTAHSAGHISPVYVVLDGAFSAITTAISATVTSSLYVELREWKDGPSAEGLADIFA